jgi:hypothetical protein
MSAAATAAGYLYASGRLRGRGARDQEHGAGEAKPKVATPQKEADRPKTKQPLRVAVLPKEEAPVREHAKRAPRIQYRVRRWRPGQEPHESE